MQNFSFLNEKTILVTGGTGSFGRAFVDKLLSIPEIKKIIVFSRDEFKQGVMQKEINDPKDRVRFFLGDVRDLPRLERAFHGVDIVVHAAALKQVPTLEYNPFEAVKTNILGSQNVIEAAIDQGVKKVLLISTDKAAQPVNLYGSTKLCAEKLFIAGNVYADRISKFSCVRYGNVIGSRGSIVEHLLKNKDNPVVHITDERMTRFWINFDQAFSVVFFALQNMEGGELFIPKAPAMKVSDLFDIVSPKSKKEVIGIRPGEKIHEVLLTVEEARHSIELKNYYVVLPEDKNIHNEKKWQKIKKGSKILPKDFYYSSDNNPQILTEKDLLQVIKKFQ